MKYNVGDKVRIKSLDWYNENKDEYGYIDCGSREFFTKMSDWCGKIATIKEICKTNCYHLEEYGFDWTDEMIEGLVEEEALKQYEVPTGSIKIWDLPKGYQFVDENGNVINATKIILEKGNKYPKTYEECCEVLGYDDRETYCVCHTGANERLFENLYRLKVCRDAYWKIVGEEKGLGKPWEPDWKSLDPQYIILYQYGSIDKAETHGEGNYILAFPTEDMRDAFKENFDPDIEFCRELL